MKERIRARRKAMQMTLQEVADLAGTGKSYVWEIEKGNKNLSAQKLYKIAIALETTMDYLLLGQKEEGINEARLLRCFHKMDAEDQIKLLKMASILT